MKKKTRIPPPSRDLLPRRACVFFDRRLVRRRLTRERQTYPRTAFHRRRYTSLKSFEHSLVLELPGTRDARRSRRKRYQDQQPPRISSLFVPFFSLALSERNFSSLSVSLRRSLSLRLFFFFSSTCRTTPHTRQHLFLSLSLSLPSFLSLSLSASLLEDSLLILLLLPAAVSSPSSSSFFFFCSSSFSFYQMPFHHLDIFVTSVSASFIFCWTSFVRESDLEMVSRCMYSEHRADSPKAFVSEATRQLCES